jgi:serine/threonine-protein kinase
MTDPLARDGFARLGLSCIRCHDRGVQKLTDNVRDVLTKMDLPLARKERLLDLYVPQAQLEEQLVADQGRFLSAQERIHGRRLPLDDPLITITRRFLTAAWADTSPEPFVRPVRLILNSETQATKNLVKLASWERRETPPGPRILPLDGLTYPNYEPDAGPVPIKIEARNKQTNTSTTVFFPNEELIILITNIGDKPLYFELVFADLYGTIRTIQPERPLDAGKTYRYPADRKENPRPFLRIVPPAGKDYYILYASEKKFPEGQRLRGENEGENMADRVLHSFYELSPDHREVRTSFEPAHLTKKTIEIETRARK